MANPLISNNYRSYGDINHQSDFFDGHHHILNLKYK